MIAIANLTFMTSSNIEPMLAMSLTLSTLKREHRTSKNASEMRRSSRALMREIDNFLRSGASGDQCRDDEETKEKEDDGRTVTSDGRFGGNNSISEIRMGDSRHAVRTVLTTTRWQSQRAKVDRMNCGHTGDDPPEMIDPVHEHDRLIDDEEDHLPLDIISDEETQAAAVDEHASQALPTDLDYHGTEEVAKVCIFTQAQPVNTIRISRLPLHEDDDDQAPSVTSVASELTGSTLIEDQCALGLTSLLEQMAGLQNQAARNHKRLRDWMEAVRTCVDDLERNSQEEREKVCMMIQKVRDVKVHKKHAPKKEEGGM